MMGGTVFMQDIHMTFNLPPEQVRKLAEDYEDDFRTCDNVALIDWGFSCKKQHGYIVLEWVDEVAAEFVAQVQADEQVEDYCVYDVPCCVDEYL